MGARVWTPQQRQKQAQAIKRWKPWIQSTGPKSKEGKDKVSQNAYKGSEWSTLRKMVKELNLVLRKQKDLVG